MRFQSVFLVLLLAMVLMPGEGPAQTGAEKPKPNSAIFALKLDIKGNPYPYWNQGKARVFSFEGVKYLYANAMVEDSAENLVIAGGPDFTLYRFGKDGSPDKNMNFYGVRQVIPYHASKQPGSEGMAFRHLTANAVANPLNLSYDMVYAGYGRVSPKTRAEAFVGRLLRNGQTDHTFGEDGLVSISEKVLPPGSADDLWTFGLAQDGGGNYFAAVTHKTAGGKDLGRSTVGVIRLDKTGGRARLHRFSHPGFDLTGAVMKTAGRHHYLVGTYSTLKNARDRGIFILRFSRDSLKLDTSYGDQGFVITPINSGPVEVHDASVAAGHLAVAASLTLTTDRPGIPPIQTRAVVALFNREQGTLNPMFSGDGIRILDPTSLKASFDSNMAVAVDIKAQVYLLNTITQNQRTYPCLTILDASGEPLLEFRTYKEFSHQPDGDDPKFLGKLLMHSKDGGLYLVGEMHYGE
jgi:hypothetical protein